MISLNYTQAVDYIETIPGFTRKHPLEHTKELLARLGDPQESFQVIHVAGTNGKGSVCAYLDSMLLFLDEADMPREEKRLHFREHQHEIQSFITDYNKRSCVIPPR